MRAMCRAGSVVLATERLASPEKPARNATGTFRFMNADRERDADKGNAMG